MQIKLKNKKAEGNETAINPIIVIIICIVLLALILIGIFRFGLIDKIKNAIPGFGGNEKEEREMEHPNLDSSNQPTEELKKENKCIGFDFYWADQNGKQLPNQVEPGKVFIVIKIPATAENLEDFSNSCGEYYILVQRKAPGLSTYAEAFVDKILFYQLIENEKKSINGADYYFIEEDVEDPAVGSSNTYYFEIHEPGQFGKLIRISKELVVETPGPDGIKKILERLNPFG